MNKLEGKTFADLNIGDRASFEVLIDKKLVDEFANISGDMNPLHTNESFAKDTEFGQRIAQGMLGGALISRLIGMHLPGLNALYLSQNLNFKSPIFLGTTVIVWGEIIQKTEAFKVLKINTQILNKDTDQVLIDGFAMAKVLK